MGRPCSEANVCKQLSIIGMLLVVFSERFSFPVNEGKFSSFVVGAKVGHFCIVCVADVVG